MRTIVITGAASGIGLACVRVLAAQGHRVISVDLRKADVDGDLSVPEGRRAVLSRIEDVSGRRIDAVVACAGLSTGDPADIIAVNFFGATELISGLRPMLAQAKAPRALAISSEALILSGDADVVDACLAADEPSARAAAGRAAPGAVYPASKLALSRWVKREAVKSEWAGAGILLNAIAPGVVRTPMTASLLGSAEGLATLNETTPMRLGKPAEPEELALLVRFLAGPENSFILGQTIFCDGGAEATLRPEQV
jgi:NAD(P)-dependent dehydrogenase (short-subunit alcohol dehydrogenase family)